MRKNIPEYVKRIVAIMLCALISVVYIPTAAFAATEPQTKTIEQLIEEPMEDEGTNNSNEEADPSKTNDASKEIPDEEGTKTDSKDIDAEDDGKADYSSLSAAGSSAERGRISVSVKDNDELLEKYFDTQVKKEIPKKKSGKLRASSATRGSRLTGRDSLVYGYLKTQIAKIAAGETDDSRISIPVAYLIDPENPEKVGVSFTADDLGVSGIVEDGSISSDAIDAFEKKIEYDYEAVVDALLYDLPYDFYWFDKTKSYLHGGNYQYSAHYENNEWVLTIINGEDDSLAPACQFTFSVANSYKGDFEEEIKLEGGRVFSYRNLDKTKTSATTTAVEEARSIITKNSDKNDLEKLSAYKDAICGLTDYNYEAARNENTSYGAPWQMIYVFDKEPSTKVVCEGYSKAFQFLCDNSIFNSKVIECYSVSGKMDNGDHMWNIMHMDDGKNYIADITNCDNGINEEGKTYETIGYPDKLFLARAVSGSVANGYGFNCDTDDDIDIIYTYDDDTKALFSESELTILLEGQHNHVWSEPIYTWAEDHITCTAERNCTADGCAEKESEIVNAVFAQTKKASCTEKGEVTYTAEFTNAAFSVQNVAIETNALGHSMEHHAAVPASCVEGKSEYWYCNRCKLFFNDENGKNETTEDALIIPATGEHVWSDVSYSWNDEKYLCTAMRRCTRENCDELEKETIRAELTEVTEDPTASEDGKGVYTAEFENDAFATQKKTLPVKYEMVVFLQGDIKLYLESHEFLSEYAWIEKYNGGSYALDLKVKTYEIEQHPDIEGKTIVYIEEDSGEYDIHAYDNTGYAIVSVVFEDEKGKEYPHSFRVDVTKDPYDFLEKYDYYYGECNDIPLYIDGVKDLLKKGYTFRVTLEGWRWSSTDRLIGGAGKGIYFKEGYHYYLSEDNTSIKINNGRLTDSGAEDYHIIVELLDRNGICVGKDDAYGITNKINDDDPRTAKLPIKVELTTETPLKGVRGTAQINEYLLYKDGNKITITYMDRHKEEFYALIKGDKKGYFRNKKYSTSPKDQLILGAPVFEWGEIMGVYNDTRIPVSFAEGGPVYDVIMTACDINVEGATEENIAEELKQEASEAINAAITAEAEAKALLSQAEEAAAAVAKAPAGSAMAVEAAEKAQRIANEAKEKAQEAVAAADIAKAAAAATGDADLMNEADSTAQEATKDLTDASNEANKAEKVKEETKEAQRKADSEAEKVKEETKEAQRKADSEAEKKARQASAELAEWNGNLSGAIPAAKSVKAKAGKKKATVSWKKATKKNLKKFDKVEIQVCPDKGFDRSNTVRKEVKKSKKSVTVKGLQKKKTYWVRVRDVKGSGTGKLVSRWSTAKKVKIK